jgi:hypothetical protein
VPMSRIFIHNLFTISKKIAKNPIKYDLSSNLLIGIRKILPKQTPSPAMFLSFN